MKPIYRRGALKHNMAFTGTIVIAIMAVIAMLCVIGHLIYLAVGVAFALFPWHSMVALVLFWLWLSYKILPEVEDYDD
jgi:hypothetical protein